MSVLLLFKKATSPSPITPLPPVAADAKQRQIAAEAKVFTDWLSAQGVGGVLGEHGVPNNTDVALWGSALDFYYRTLAAAGVWNYKWASGPAWGTSYNLGDYVDNSGSNGTIATAQAQTAIVATYASVHSGVSVAGAEFPMSGGGIDRSASFYRYPNAASIAYLASQGVKTIRFPLAWERLQPTLNAALDATQLTNLDGVLQACASNGITVNLDLHNYARYTLSGSTGTPLVRTGGAVNASHLADFWTRLSTWVKADTARNATVAAYSLMNEPHDLAAETGSFSGANRYTFDTTAQGWAGESGNFVASWDSSTFHASSGSLKVAATGLATGGYAQIRANDSGTNAGGVLSGDTLSAWVKLDAAVAGSWTAKLEYQNSSFQWIAPTNNVPLVAGQWVQVICPFASAIPATARAFDIQINTNSNNQAAVSFWLDDYQQGSQAAGLSAARVWESISQTALDAIRANSDTRLVIVPGYAWSAAYSWSTNHPVKWITDPASNHRYEAHHYWDTDHSGQYLNSYATELAAATSSGF